MKGSAVILRGDAQQRGADLLARFDVTEWLQQRGIEVRDLFSRGNSDLIGAGLA